MQSETQVQKLLLQLPPWLPLLPPYSKTASHFKNPDMADIEEIDSRLPYRVGYPKLPAYPVYSAVFTMEQELYFPSLDEHIKVIRDILSKHNVTLIDHMTAYRVSRSSRILEDYAHNPTLMLVADYEHDHRHQWVKAAQKIRTHLAQSGIHRSFELVDPSSEKHKTSPILSEDHELIADWNEVHPKFLSMIEDRNWKAIDVLYRDFPSRGMLPTVIISAQDANSHILWDSTLSSLRQLLQVHNLTLDIVVLYLENITLAMADTPDTPTVADSLDRDVPSPHIPEDFRSADARIQWEFYGEEFSMGTSCALANSNGSGTLGGRITLKKDSATLELGITNYHIFRSAFPVSTSGPFHPLPENSYGIAVCPSDLDHAFVVQALEKQANKGHRPQNLKPYLEAIKRHDRSSGIYAASGIRSYQNPCTDKGGLWALDWCLIRRNQRGFSYELQEVPESAYAKSGQEARHYCTISSSKNYSVLKRGRTTGWTKGTISAIASTLRLQEKGIPGPTVPTNQEISLARQIVFVHGVIGTHEKPKFMKPGDSGCLVLLDEASNIPGVPIVGLGFAANDNTHASYMMPMDLVVEDIERVTGGKVEEPSYGGEL
ncbi:hypothetical protein GQ44DRAFT_823101 [Phaeosphaeriaceae sp. PMI808]|nr:hypothetical protein GQ44DRAFT_823101 [Phaeosphaeriaceae sp. PMI808]